MPKATRRSHVTHACDECRRRKIRCEISVQTLQPCKQCLGRDALCTYDIPVSRRGPPKRFSDRLLVATPSPRNETEPTCRSESEPSPVNVSPEQTSEHAFGHALTGLAGIESPAIGSVVDQFSPPPSEPNICCNVLSTIPSLCSPELMRTALRDYLELLYPTIPVVHIPSFLIDLDANRHAIDASFLCLTFSLFALVVAMLPRKFEHYRNIDSGFGLEFADRRQLVDRVHSLVLENQAVDYFDDLTTTKWASAHTRMTAYACLGFWSRAAMLRAEAETIVLELKCHRVSSYAGLDKIETQLRKKIFWMTLTARV